MNPAVDLAAAGALEGLVSVRVGPQWFGVPVLKVQDVIADTVIHRVPLAPPEVAGSLNLRGRIVTAIEMRRRLKVEPREAGEKFMCVIVEHHAELYALLVDDVGDVLWLSGSERESSPVTLPAHWRAICSGLYRLEQQLLLALEIPQVLALSAGAGLPN
jgi:purine-binding chemotaxis protein CheW